MSARLARISQKAARPSEQRLHAGRRWESIGVSSLSNICGCVCSSEVYNCACQHQGSASFRWEVVAVAVYCHNDRPHAWQYHISCTRKKVSKVVWRRWNSVCIHIYGLRLKSGPRVCSGQQPSHVYRALWSQDCSNNSWFMSHLHLHDWSYLSS